MKKCYFIIVVLLFGSSISLAQNYQWAQTCGGVENDNAVGNVTDASGNVFVTGYFNGTFDADPGPGVTTLTDHVGGGNDFYISKYDTSGNFMWAKSIGGSDFDTPTAITIDNSGNIYVVGYFAYQVDFNPGVGVANLGTNSLFTPTGFLLKLDNDGNFLWAKQMDVNPVNGNVAIVNSVAVDTNNNVTVGGYFKGVFVAQDDVRAYTSVSGSYDAFVVKYNASGIFQWSYVIGSGGSEAVNGLKTDSNGNVFVAGNFNSLVDFDSSVVVQNLGTTGLTDAFILKLNSGGSCIWVNKIGGLGEDYGRNVTVSPTNEVYLAGNFNGTVNFSSNTAYSGLPPQPANNIASNGSTDNFIVKLDNSNGNTIWAKTFGSSSADYITSIVTNQTGNVFATGYFNSTVDFDPNASTYNLTSNGGTDVFILRLNNVGDFENAYRFGGSGNDQGNGLFIDMSGNVFTAGSFSGTCYFNPESLVSDSKISSGLLDGFSQKIAMPVLGTNAFYFGKLEVNIYPNPTSDKVTISSETPIKNITVFSLLGQMVLTTNDSVFSTANLSNGWYLVKIEDENGAVAMKKLQKK